MTSTAARPPARSAIPPSEDEAWWRYALAQSGKRELDKAETRALSRASGAAGNFLVPADVEDKIVSAARTQSAIARLARTVTTDSGSTLTVPVSTSHGTAAWQGENAAGTSTDDTFAEVPLGAFKASTRTIPCEELARDSRVPFDELGRRLVLLESVAFAAGSGTGQPQGISVAAGAVPVVTAATGSTASFKLADIVSTYNALPAAYHATATWVFHPTTFASLASLADTAGGLVLPSLQSAEPSLLGRPVEIDAGLAAPAASARSAVFADFEAAYTIRRVAGISVQRLEELYSDNGQLGYRAVERVDARVTLPDAARVLAHSAT